MKTLKDKGIIVVIITLMLVMVLGVINDVYGEIVDNLYGVSQGSNNISYLDDVPARTIIIDRTIIDDPTKCEESILPNYLNSGFEILTQTEINEKCYTTNRKFDIGGGNRKFLVYDESKNNGTVTKITGKTDGFTSFTGPVAKFKYEDAAVLSNGTKANVVITYSDISFSMQKNFGEHDEEQYQAKYDSTDDSIDNPTYEDFYSTPDGPMNNTDNQKIMAGVGNLKDGYKVSDFWGYDSENDKGVYNEPGLYTIGFGKRLQSWNNLIRDSINDNDNGYTTRYGTKMNIKIQVVDDNDTPINGTFFYLVMDIDVNRVNTQFKQLWDAENQNYFSETISVNSGVASNSSIYIPGDVRQPGVYVTENNRRILIDNSTQATLYKYTGVSRADNTSPVVFTGKSDHNDNYSSTYSGFVTVVDNNQGINLTYWTSGAQGVVVNTHILSGFYNIVSSTGRGGTIKTTLHGNQNGNLSQDNEKDIILDSGTFEVDNGKTVKYTMTPKDNYWLKEVIVDGKNVTLPTTVGATTTIELDGPTNNKRIGILTKKDNGVYVFEFPNNNYDHTIHVHWDAAHYFIKEWIPGDDADELTINAKAYKYNQNQGEFEYVNLSNQFTVHKNSSLNGDTVSLESITDEGGKVIWKIKKTGLSIEIPTSHANNRNEPLYLTDHDEPLYWFAEEAIVPTKYNLTGYSNSAVLESIVQGENSKGAYMSINDDGGIIKNKIKPEYARKIIITKVWDDGGLDNSIRPTPEIYLTRDETDENLLIPSEYQEVEYIQATGEQWINTGIQMNAAHTIKIDGYMLAGDGNYGSLISGSVDTNNRLGCTFYGKSGGIAYYWILGTGRSRQQISTGGLNGINITQRFQSIQNSSGIIITQGSNEFFISYSGKTSGTGSNNWYIFNSISDNGKPVGVLYNGKILDGETLLHEYVPCYRKSDGVIGVYDTVTNKFLTNAGTGTFNKGPEVDRSITSTIEIPSEVSGWIKNNDNTWTYEFLLLNDDNNDYKVWEKDVSNYSGDASKSDPKDVVDNKATITNTSNNCSISLEKIVTGNMADIDKKFKFTVIINADSGEEYPVSGIYRIKDGDNYVEPAEKKITSGTSIYLKHGETIVIQNIPKGTSYQIQEDREGYTAKYKKGSDAERTGNSVSGILNTHETIIFTNDKNESVLTGIFTDNNPFVILILISTVTIIVIYTINLNRLNINVKNRGKINKKAKIIIAKKK